MLTTKSQHNALVNLFHQGTKLTYKKGEFVIRPGEMPSGIFYIVKGLVKTYDITKYGEENLLIIRKQGEVLGLTGAIAGQGQSRSMIYSTLAPTELMYITKEQFMTFLNTNPEAAMPLIDTLVSMYLMHSDRILTLEYRSVRERLVSFLLTTAKRFGEAHGNEVVLEVPLKHQDIASSISATRETTSRELATLERQGLISRDKQSIITLLDVEKLHSYLS